MSAMSHIVDNIKIPTRFNIYSCKNCALNFIICDEMMKHTNKCYATNKLWSDYFLYHGSVFHKSIFIKDQRIPIKSSSIDLKTLVVQSHVPKQCIPIMKKTSNRNDMWKCLLEVATKELEIM